MHCVLKSTVTNMKTDELFCFYELLCSLCNYLHDNLFVQEEISSPFLLTSIYRYSCITCYLVQNVTNSCFNDFVEIETSVKIRNRNISLL